MLGDDLSDQAIVLGLERNVFNLVEYYPVEARQRHIEQDRERYLRSLRTLQGSTDQRTQESSVQKPVDNVPAATPSAHGDAQRVAEDIRPHSDMLLQLKFTKSWDFHNAAWQLSRINTLTKGDMDQPVLLSMLDELMKRVTTSAEYKHEPRKYHRVMTDAADKLPDTEFKRRMLQKLPQVSPEQTDLESPPPTVQTFSTPAPPEQTSRHTTVTPEHRETRVHEPVPPRPVISDQLVQRYQLTATGVKTIGDIFEGVRNEEEVENALAACDYLYSQGCQFPFAFLLQGMKKIPAGGKKYCRLSAWC